MVRVARFEKVSLRRFVTDWVATFPQQTVEQAVAAYERIRLPERATSGSAGYDLFAPVGFELGAGEGIKIPTGLRVLIEEGWVLTIYPRSGLGFKYRFQLDNSVGVIDSDYARSDNEGHIFMRMTNDNREGKSLIVPSGTAFAQGIFLPFGITVDDHAQGVRNGGLGSTTRPLKVKETRPSRHVSFRIGYIRRNHHVFFSSELSRRERSALSNASVTICRAAR